MENFISPLRFKKSNYVIRLFSNKAYLKISHVIVIVVVVAVIVVVNYILRLFLLLVIFVVFCVVVLFVSLLGSH